MTPKINGIHEVALVVTDLDRSEKFYSEVLGMDVIGRIPGVCSIMKMGESPYHFIGLWLPNAHSAYQNNSHGKFHFVMKIDIADVNAWDAHFKACGVHAPKRPVGNGDVHFDFEDPDGHPLEFWARSRVELSPMPGLEVPAEFRGLFCNLDQT